MITTQNIAFLGRRTDQNSYRTLMRTTATGNLYVRIEMYELASYSSVVNDGWHNIKLFYNAGESRYGVISCVYVGKRGWNCMVLCGAVRIVFYAFLCFAVLCWCYVVMRYVVMRYVVLCCGLVWCVVVCCVVV